MAATDGHVLQITAGHQTFDAPSVALAEFATTLAAVPTISGPLITDVITQLTALTNWLDDLRTALIAQGVVVAP